MDLFGYNKVDNAINVLKTFEPEQGYYLAFSGGKDSQCIYHLAKMAGVKFDAHYNLTTVDPPELVWFIKKNYPDVIIHRPKETMWNLIIRNGIPPLRNSRYCCAELKELGGVGRIVVIGIRWAESTKRKKNRNLIEANAYTSKKRKFNQDNEESRRLLEVCPTKGKHILNPIINWLDSDVWDFLNSNSIEHCKLYDNGFTRIGCVGCPMDSRSKINLDKFPKFKAQYIRTFQKMYERLISKRLNTFDNWKDGQSVYDWWVSKKARNIEVDELELGE